MDDGPSCGLVLLAAGASTRMGGPKQLLPVRGRPLLRLVAEAALAAPVSPVVAVLGAEAGRIAPALDGLPVHLVTNPTWAEGMGSSLRVGLRAVLEREPRLQAVLVVLADQPGVQPAHLRRLVALWRESGRAIVASESAGLAQPPALFTARLFPRLLTLQGDAGARTLLKEHRDTLALVPLADAADLDTPQDYAKYTAGSPADGHRPARA